MLTFPLPSSSSVARQVRRVIGRRKPIRGRLRSTSHLVRELQFDLLDLVDIILALENYFHITIPDEVTLITVGDVVEYVAAELQRPRRS